MIDLFAVNDFISFLKKEYPEINVNVKYDPINFELQIQFDYMKTDYHYRTIRKFISNTKEAIGAICFYHTDFLACLSEKGVKLNGSND